jgi:hypothetical protein
MKEFGQYVVLDTHKKMIAVAETSGGDVCR